MGKEDCKMQGGQADTTAGERQKGESEGRESSVWVWERAAGRGRKAARPRTNNNCFYISIRVISNYNVAQPNALMKGLICR